MRIEDICKASGLLNLSLLSKKMGLDRTTWGKRCKQGKRLSNEDVADACEALAPLLPLARALVKHNRVKK